MEALLSRLIEEKAEKGIAIGFFEPPGDRKESVLRKVPELAVRILQNQSDSIVVAMPDLYPLNKSFPHTTAEQLRGGVVAQFEQAVKRLKVSGINMAHFKAFCFKHDLEALVLAAEPLLAKHLGIRQLKRTWKTPVEDQNKDHPPKTIIEQLFVERGKSYRETLDTPIILAYGQKITSRGQRRQNRLNLWGKKTHPAENKSTLYHSTAGNTGSRYTGRSNGYTLINPRGRTQGANRQ